MFSLNRGSLILLTLLTVVACSKTAAVPAAATPTVAPLSTGLQPSEISTIESANPGPTLSFTPTQQSLPTITPGRAGTGYPGENEPTPTSRPLPTAAPSLTLAPSPTVALTVQGPPTYHVDELRMFDANTGWMMYLPVPESLLESKILRTSKGAQTWVNVSPPVTKTSASYPVVSFLNAQVAVAVSSKSFLPYSATVELTPWRTMDAGQTWQAGDSLKLDQGNVLEVSMFDQDLGWMLAQSIPSMGSSCVSLYRTQDGGSHWEIVYDIASHCASGDKNALRLFGFYPYRKNIVFASGSRGFFSNGSLFFSQNGGESWQSQLLPPPSKMPSLVCLGTDNCQYGDVVSVPQFVSPRDRILIRRVYPMSKLNPPFLGDEQYHLPLPTAQFFYYTHDGGANWISRPSPAKIGTVSFLNTRTGWILGKNEADPSTPTQLYQTRDGGESWTQISAVCPLPLGSEIQFVDDQTGFAFLPFPISRYYQDFDARIGDGNGEAYFFATQDGGHSWEKIKVLPGATSQ